METFITNDEKLIILVCGLPARGKSFLSRKIAKFLIWIGFDTKVFSIGQFRRELIDKEFDIRFFNNKNEKCLKLRDDCIFRVIEDMTKYLEDKGKIAVIDGTNIRITRRRMIENLIQKNFENSQKIKKYDFLLIESKVTSEKILANLFNSKLLHEDYKNWEPKEAFNDYVKRIEIFENIYEQISEENDPERSFISIQDQGVEIITRNLKGYLPSKVLSYLINLQFNPTTIFLTRHGESEYNKLGKIGGDSLLSEKGANYAERIKDFILNFTKEEEKSKI